MAGAWRGWRPGAWVTSPRSGDRLIEIGLQFCDDGRFEAFDRDCRHPAYAHVELDEILTRVAPHLDAGEEIAVLAIELFNGSGDCLGVVDMAGIHRMGGDICPQLLPIVDGRAGNIRPGGRAAGASLRMCADCR